MKPDKNSQSSKVDKSHGFTHLFEKLGTKITNLFKPEEVEVTFKLEGKKMTYSYKVTEKQVA